jgi:site-specific DNA-methyltransferase (adenine-specific)
VITLHHGDCLEHLRTLADNSVDAVVTDPPYGLSAPPDIAVVLAAWMAGERYEHKGGGFMSAAWDSFVPGPQVWGEVFRVLKPGGHAVVFAGTRTVDLMGISVRLAGFEVRDTLHWAYWSGFPKSLDLSKAMDALHGAERIGGFQPVPRQAGGIGMGLNRQCAACGKFKLAPDPCACADSGPATEDAKRWAGWGTAVKPAIEPALLLRKPISESSIARNVLRWGTGGLNIDACRFAPGDPMWPGPDGDPGEVTQGMGGNRTSWRVTNAPSRFAGVEANGGRFPANLIHAPKASRAERELGCEGLPTKTGAEATGSKEGQARLDSPRTGAGRSADAIRNFHPTVKPLGLMRWMVRLVTPPSGVVLDRIARSLELASSMQPPGRPLTAT